MRASWVFHSPISVPMILRFLFLFLASLLPGVSAVGQTAAPSADRPVRLVDIAAPRTLDAGGVGHFRAQVAPESMRPVNYLWDFGDGTLSVGTLVSHAYTSPGTYTLMVTARNERGRDTLTAQVTVEVPREDAGVESPTSAAPASAPEEAAAPSDERGPDDTAAPARRVTFSRTALFGGGGVTHETGGVTWVLASDLWAERARDRMLYHRLRGLRADVVVDTTGRGSPAYRVVVGQFASEDEALAARAWLPDETDHAWLLKLEPTSRTARP